MLTNDFNIDSYNAIIKKIIANGYKFVSFPKQNKLKLSNQKEVLLRHDIDFSLTAAREIAQHDYNSGIRSTFFIYLNTPFYNILFEDDKKQIDEIVDFGHDIALHFNEKINIGLDKEIEILSKVFSNVRTDLISFHKPRIDYHTKTNIRNNIPEQILTSYDDTFFKDIKYISDSKCSFNETKFASILDSNKSFQLLIHPVWWYFNGNSPTEKIKALWNGKLSEVIENVKKNISLELQL